MKYSINDTELSYEASGEKVDGDEIVLLENAIDLTAGKQWSAEGFTIEPLFSPERFEAFYEEIHHLLTSCWRNAGLDIPSEFPLDQYHQRIKDASEHFAAIDKTRLLLNAHFPLGISGIEERLSEICGCSLRARNPYDGQSIFHFRVIRPQSKDNNPLHRDVWLEDYEDCINLYIPVAGSNTLSSLIILPGSHLWPESRIQRTVSGCEINGVKFNVPAVTEIRGHYKIARPDPKQNEVLVFSPYLIHGGSVNLNTDSTRISIELRLWKA